jgi:hypothetical protein
VVCTDWLELDSVRVAATSLRKLPTLKVEKSTDLFSGHTHESMNRVTFDFVLVKVNKI